MISRIGAVVLMSAAIVPNSPMKTLVAGLIAVSMNPLAMLIAKARGTWDFGPLMYRKNKNPFCQENSERLN